MFYLGVETYGNIFCLIIGELPVDKPILSQCASFCDF